MDDWGVYINRFDHDSMSPPAPDWLSIKGQNVWKWRGLIVWRRNPEQVICMQPGYAAKIIKDFHKSKKWQSDGYVIGEWGFSFEVNVKTKESKTSEPGLLNPMRLSSEQCKKLVSFLESNQDVIQQLCEEDIQKHEMAIESLAYLIAKSIREKENKEDG